MSACIDERIVAVHVADAARCKEDGRLGSQRARAGEWVVERCNLKRIGAGPILKYLEFKMF